MEKEERWIEWNHHDDDDDHHDDDHGGDDDKDEDYDDEQRIWEERDRPLFILKNLNKPKFSPPLESLER